MTPHALCRAGLVLAANLSLVRYALPTRYNYAFRRDRERLPASEGRRLRAGMFGQTATINVHFVSDGKPWQLQNLTHYPSWLASARIWYVSEWHRLARSMRPHPFEIMTGAELRLLGDVQHFRWAQQSRAPLLGATTAKARRDCRCFLKSLQDEKKKHNPLAMLRREAKTGMYTEPTKEELTELERISHLVLNERRQLLDICGGGSHHNETHPREAQQCLKMFALEIAKGRGIATRYPNATGSRQEQETMYSDFIRFLDKFKAVPVKNVYADLLQCRLAHWFSRIKSAGKPPQTQLRRQIGDEAVHALLQRVASMPTLHSSTLQREYNATPHKRACDPRWVAAQLYFQRSTRHQDQQRGSINIASDAADEP